MLITSVINDYYHNLKLCLTQNMIVYIKNKSIDTIVKTISELLFMIAFFQCAYFGYTLFSFTFASNSSRNLKLISCFLSLISLANFANSKYKNNIDMFFQFINCILSLVFFEVVSFIINSFLLVVLFHKDVLLEILKTDVKEIIGKLKDVKKNDINNTAFHLGFQSLSLGILGFIKSRKEKTDILNSSAIAINESIEPIHNKLKEIKENIDTRKFRKQLSSILCIIIGLSSLIFYYKLLNKFVLVFWLISLVKHFNYENLIPIEVSIINIITIYENSLLNIKSITNTVCNVLSFGFLVFKLWNKKN